MAWDEGFDASGGGSQESIELVGTNLRMIGVVSLGRFGRLTDLINASSGYLRVRDARLLSRNGEPTASTATARPKPLSCWTVPMVSSRKT